MASVDFLSTDSVSANDSAYTPITKRTTPGSLYLLSNVMNHGGFTGDETLNIDKTIHIIDNYVWIGDQNTQINVKGQSAYEVYVEVARRRGEIPLTEEEWIASLGADFETIYNYAVRSHGYPHTMHEFYSDVPNYVDVESEN